MSGPLTIWIINYSFKNEITVFPLVNIFKVFILLDFLKN